MCAARAGPPRHMVVTTGPDTAAIEQERGWLVRAECHAEHCASDQIVKHLYWHNAVAIHVGGSQLSGLADRVGRWARGAERVFGSGVGCLLPPAWKCPDMSMWVYFGNGDLVTAPAVRPFWDSSTAVQSSNGLAKTKLASC